MSFQEPSTPARSGVFCAVHPERTAATLCNRCGSYACVSCFQVAHDRQDYCLSCLPRIRPALAERGSRLAAALVDHAVLFVPAVLCVILVGLLANALGAPGMLILMLVAGPGLLTLLCSGLWQLYLLATTGQSVGKRMMGIQVVRTDGSPVDLPRLLFLRNLVPALLSVPTWNLFGLIDTLVIFTRPRRCLHDHLADTQVVVVPRGVSP